MALKEIRTEGDEVLRGKCRPVDRITPRIRQHLDDLEDTMKNAGNGAGLAAPQIGILRRLIVVDTPDGTLRLINPEVIQAEGEQRGCGGLPQRAGCMGEDHASRAHQGTRDDGKRRRSAAGRTGRDGQVLLP